jgi:hypothetical protein
VAVVVEDEEGWLPTSDVGFTSHDSRPEYDFFNDL